MLDLGYNDAAEEFEGFSKLTGLSTPLPQALKPSENLKMPTKNDYLRILTTKILPDGISEGLRALTVQSYVEANSKNGAQHEGSTILPAVPALGVNDTIFLTGSKPVALKGRVISYSGEGVVGEIYGEPTYTGGTEAPYQNASDINPVAGESKIIVGATITDDGYLPFAPVYALGNKSNQGQGSTLSVLGSERLLKPNTAYLLRLASLDSAAQDISSFLTWYEGDLDLPLP